MKKIFFSPPLGEARSTFFTPDLLQKLGAMGDVIFNESTTLTKQQLAVGIADAEICVTGWGCPFFDDEVLKDAKQLKLITHCGGSVANHIGQEVFDHGIRVVTGNDVFAHCVAEGALAYILVGLRNICGFASAVQRNGWSLPGMTDETLLHKSVGLVGFGAVARHLVPMLKVFGCKVSAYDPLLTDDVFEQYGVIKSSLPDTLSKNKVISVHAAKTEGTHHILNREMLSLIQDGSLLVNTARGTVIDEAALADELASGRIKAVLDVYQSEPLPLDSPLRNLPNVTLMPHRGGPTIDHRPTVSSHVIDDIGRYINNIPMLLEVTAQYALGMTKE